MGPVALGGLAGILNLFWRERQRELLWWGLMARGSAGAHTSCAGERLLGSTHIPSPPCPAPTASAHRLVSVPQMLLRGLVRAARGSAVGNCSAPRRGGEGEARAGAHGECKGRAWKGLSGAGSAGWELRHLLPAGPLPNPLLPDSCSSPRLWALCSASLPVHSSKITRRAGGGKACKVLSCFSTSASCQAAALHGHMLSLPP